MAGESFEVRVEGIQFAAAHFATFGNKCEPLHGHSYEVAAEAQGNLTADSWVIDFTRLKSALREICQELDHRFLLQMESRVLRIEDVATAWRVRTPAGSEYLLPKNDVMALPIDNSTAERLAEWLSGRVWQALGQRAERDMSSLSIEVWEGPGQRASYRRGRLRQS